MPIRAVTFDLDGTLWTMGPNVDSHDWSEITAMQAKALAPHFAEWGFTGAATEIIPSFFQNLNAVLRPPTEDHHEPKWHPVVQRTFASLGQRLDDAQADIFLDILNDVPFELMGVRAYPDAAPALTLLAKRGLKLGAITNNPKKAARLQREVRDQGLPDVLEIIVTSVDCGWRKPHAVPFETALRALGVEPDEAIHVGDSHSNDIEPAIRLGMQAVFRGDPSSIVGLEPAPHHVIQSLEALPGIIAGYAD